MNVEKLQKINALANELKKHQFATSNEEAFQQAEGVYEHGKRLPEPESERLTEPAVKSADSSEHSASVPHTQTDAFTERKMQLLLEMNNKKYEQEFTILRNALNQLNGELISLKERMRTMQTPKEQPKQVQQELKTEPKASHPRQGSFTSSDVDIQKMFYFGTKR